MKQLFVLTTVAVLLIGCKTTPENSFFVNGSLTGGVTDSTQVYLRKTDSTRQLVEVDTALVINGLFNFEGTSTSPEMHYLFFEGIQGNSPLIIEKGEIDFSAQKDSLAFSTIKGSPQNEAFMDYMEEQRTMSLMARSMSDDLRAAQMRGDEATMASLREEYFELQEKSKDFEIDFIKTHPSSLVSILILERIASQRALPFSEIEALLGQLGPEIQNTDIGERIKKIIDANKDTEIGAVAPNFSGPTPDGGQLALSDALGKVTLVDFWAAWCKPCRLENPNVVAVYQKYKDKGLSVVGVSLDRKKEDWITAIEADGLDWHHVSNVQYFQDPIARLYNINSIPAAFLLDENGVIVAKNLRGAELEAKVAELLN